jgi:hypothetical protein
MRISIAIVSLLSFNAFGIEWLIVERSSLTHSDSVAGTPAVGICANIYAGHLDLCLCLTSMPVPLCA